MKHAAVPVILLIAISIGTLFFRLGSLPLVGADELERSWAAGVWTRAYDAKYQHAVGQPVTALSEIEARERLRRAGTSSQRP